MGWAGIGSPKARSPAGSPVKPTLIGSTGSNVQPGLSKQALVSPFKGLNTVSPGTATPPLLSPRAGGHVQQPASRHGSVMARVLEVSGLRRVKF